MFRNIAGQLSHAAANALDPIAAAVPRAGALSARLSVDGLPTSAASRISFVGPARPISTVVDPTRISAKGVVTNPGHVQLQTTQEEREKYGLQPAYGHSPSPLGMRGERECIRVEAQLADGRPFAVSGFRVEARSLDQDKPLRQSAATLVFDHGPLSAPQAARLKESVGRAPAVYETSGRDAANCVHVYADVATHVFGVPKSDLHPHALPQEVARLIAAQIDAYRKSGGGGGGA